jgi:glucose/arabinose dehydrogenase
MSAALLIALLTFASPRSDALVGVRVVRAFPEQPRWKRPVWFGALPVAPPAAVPERGAAAPAPGSVAAPAVAPTSATAPAALAGAALAPSTPRRHALAEQHGVVHVFAVDAAGAAGAPSVLLDLAARTSRIGNEEGLLGLAFDPEYAANGRLFVHYSLRGAQRGRLSEFRLVPGAARIEATSERVLAEIEQPYRNHNGGAIVFGPDGYLYWGLGDGGSAGDPEQNGQSLSTWLGKLLRLDVGPATRAVDAAPYTVPADNPFVRRADARPEIWAFGLRNPWRFSFDPATGALWCGDVGQNAEEEIDVVVRGGNYGWRAREGLRSFDADARRGPGPLLEPLLVYGRTAGWSVTGGHVYRGARVPALVGHYVYGDFVSGRQWAWPVAAPARADADVSPAGSANAAAREPLELPLVEAPASYGVDAWGELYVCSFNDGHLYRFEAAQGVSAVRSDGAAK